MKNLPTPVQPSVPTALSPATIDSVRLDGGFWGHLQTRNRNASLPHEVKWLSKYSTLFNFDAVLAGDIAEKRVGREFSDSDTYKVLEALSWEDARESSAELEAAIFALTRHIKPVQDRDGYLNTKFGHPGLAPRYSDMEWGHELYCDGHLIQAAVARLRTGHDESDPLVAIALRVANHVCKTFGKDGLQLVDGHPEIEVALVELYRATGDKRYLEQAQIFVDRRGKGILKPIEFGQKYFQDDIPVRETKVLHGHSVRALYLAAAAIDIAIETEDQELFDIIQKQYETTLRRRTYITGGMGSHHQDEAFGEDFELPADRAYCETCAGIGSIMVAWRLLLATGDLSYGDIIERTLYNILATSPSEDGTAFFYANTLHQRVEGTPSDPDKISLRAGSALRAPWFEVPCCPPNVSRTIAQLAAYVATTSDKGVQLIQYMPGRIDMGGAEMRVETEYPFDSRVLIHIDEAPESWELSLRIPSWAKGATIDGQDTAGPVATLENPKAGQTITLDLPLNPRFTYADQRVDGVRGCVAVEWGPMVMCVESVQQPGNTDANLFAVDPDGPIKVNVHQLLVSGEVLNFTEGPGHGINVGYRQNFESVRGEKTEIVFSPYWSWANNGPTTMRIWIPTT